MERLSGVILTPDGLVRGSVHFDGKIDAIEPGDVDGPLILPGFIDVHVHGGGGGDTMDGPEGVLKLARFHLSRGTTTLLPTTITNPWERLLEALDGVSTVMVESASRPDDILPDIPGVHFEGPFISPGRLGAQPPFAIEPSHDLVDEVLSRDVVRLVTIAPEIGGAVEAARAFARAGVRVSVGHTVADYETVVQFASVVAESGGTLGFTHLYNAMGGLEGRKPGIPAAAFALRDSYAELILDGHHLHPGAVHAARAAKGDGLMLVTDCIMAGGQGDGVTELGGQQVTVSGGAARLEDGTLAGSVLTLDRALGNALAAGIPLAEASAMLSVVPSRYLGLHDRGQIAVGKRADLVLLDHDYRVISVRVAGRKVEPG